MHDPIIWPPSDTRPTPQKRTHIDVQQFGMAQESDKLSAMQWRTRARLRTHDRASDTNARIYAGTLSGRATYGRAVCAAYAATHWLAACSCNEIAFHLN